MLIKPFTKYIFTKLKSMTYIFDDNIKMSHIVKYINHVVFHLYIKIKCENIN